MDACPDGFSIGVVKIFTCLGLEHNGTFFKDLIMHAVAQQKNVQ